MAASASATPELGQSSNEATRARKKAPARPADGEDNTNRRLLNLPRVVGSYLQYPNKYLLYRPFPSDVDEVRKKLFLVERPMLLDSQQIADYWPHISNFYMRSSRPSTNDNGTVSEAWECRIRRRVTMKSRDKIDQGTRQRHRKDELLGDVKECRARLNMISFTKHVDSAGGCGEPGLGNCLCVPEWLHVQPTDRAIIENLQHTHDIDLLDSYKRSNAVLYFCKLKVEEGQYSYATVTNWVKEKYGPTSAQLQHLTKADVANVARFWRAKNSEVELRTEIAEETDADRQRKNCLDAIQTTAAEQVRKALLEVCKVLPHAVEIIATFMGKPPDDQHQAKPIAEGDDINFPPPGRPSKRKMACDPPDPSAPASVTGRTPPPPRPSMPPLEPYQPIAYSLQAPSYPHSYPMPSQVTGFGMSMPAPSSPAALSYGLPHPIGDYISGPPPS